MITRTALLLLPVLIAAASAAVANPAYDQCLKSAATQVEMANCSGAATRRADAKLAASWRTALVAVGGSKQAAGRLLLAEQRAWIAFKDHACGEYYDAVRFGSNGRTILGPACRVRLTDARTAYLGHVAAQARDKGQEPS